MRFTLAAVIYDKRPVTIVDKVMKLWIASGFGVPGKFLADNGGEFAIESFCDMCENLTMRLETAYS